MASKIEKIAELYLEANPAKISEVAFLAVHDYNHYLTHSDFSLEGEIKAYRSAASRAPSLEIQKILYSEIVLKAVYYWIIVLVYIVSPRSAYNFMQQVEEHPCTN